MSGKINFGIKNLYFATYTQGDGAVGTVGTPIAIPGAKSLTLEPQGDSNTEYADDVAYWSDYSDNGFSGTVTVEKFTDEFKKTFLGYSEMSDGGLAQIKGATRTPACIMFEANDDALHRRVMLVNVSLSGISREFNTVEDQVSADTESIDITVVGDNYNGATKIGYESTASGYSTLFTAPVIPTVSTTDTTTTTTE